MPGVVQQYIQDQEARERAIGDLRHSREQTIEHLARVSAHPETAGLKEYKRYGELAKVDRELETQKLAVRVERYGKQYAGWAEEEISKTFVKQLRNGSGEINLSQKYQTDNPTEALGRHRQALMNLGDYIWQAEKLGYKVNRGEAVAVGHAEKQQEGIRVAL